MSGVVSKRAAHGTLEGFFERRQFTGDTPGRERVGGGRVQRCGETRNVRADPAIGSRSLAEQVPVANERIVDPLERSGRAPGDTGWPTCDVV